MEVLLEACQKFNAFLPLHGKTEALVRKLKLDPVLKNHFNEIAGLLHSCGEVYSPKVAPPTPSDTKPFRAVCWNIERGKNFSGILKTLQQHPHLQNADFYFLTEVDWGMARSHNRHITADLGKALGYFAYFAPSYYNLSKGHGAERQAEGENEVGLHGKALLSRYPLARVRSVPLPNCHDKLNSKESRIGQKRALLGEVKLGGKTLTLVIAHLDAFSSPRSRKNQLRPAVEACRGKGHVLLGGDWNTNTLDSTSTPRLLSHLLFQALAVRPVPMIRDHLPYPERRFDRPLFKMLEKSGFDTLSSNARGEGTYDLVKDNRELGEMANDQYPRWALKTVNRLIAKAGGSMRFKLDWFAAKNLKSLQSAVVRLDDGLGPVLNQRASDHHPIYLDFQLA